MTRPDLIGPAGRLEALLDQPADQPGVNRDGLVERGVTSGVRAAVVFAHPHPQYGGTMHTKAVYQSAKALARLGCAVLRFNFRGAGSSEGTWDEGRGERDDFRTAVDFMRERYPDAPLWMAGMSFGSWIALTTAAADPTAAVLIGLAMPVNHYDFSAVQNAAKPKFFIHGERDEHCPLGEVRKLYGHSVEPKELVVIDGANHVFDGKVAELADTIEDLLGDWLAENGKDL